MINATTSFVVTHGWMHLGGVIKDVYLVIIWNVREMNNALLRQIVREE
jgi:hypothetical protein